MSPSPLAAAAAAAAAASTHARAPSAVPHADAIALPAGSGASLIRVRFPRLPLGLTLRFLPVDDAPLAAAVLAVVDEIAEVSPAAGGVLARGDVLVGMKQPGLASGRLVDLR